MLHPLGHASLHLVAVPREPAATTASPIRFPAETPQHKIDYVMRTGMMGILGMSYRLSDLPEQHRERLKFHIAFYKEHLRDLLRDGDFMPLTTQPNRDGTGERWPAFLSISRDKSRAAVFVFRMPKSDASRQIKLRNLDPAKNYHRPSAGQSQHPDPHRPATDGRGPDVRIDARRVLRNRPDHPGRLAPKIHAELDTNTLAPYNTQTRPPEDRERYLTSEPPTSKKGEKCTICTIFRRYRPVYALSLAGAET